MTPPDSCANFAEKLERRTVIVIGKDASKPKKDDLVKHGKLEDHRNSVEEKALQKKLTTAATYVRCKRAITTQMATLLVQTKECIMTRKNAPLLELQIFKCKYFLKLCYINKPCRCYMS